jgi:predicted metalloprotease with PDZ domain
VPGIPWRKVSIYNEGFLIALICDLTLIQTSQNRHSLDHVMRDLYERFGKMGKGYSKVDYQLLIAQYAHDALDDVFDELVNGTSEYLPFLQSACAIAGLQIQANPSNKVGEAAYGMSVDEGNQKVIISAVVPDSPADAAGLWYGDEILSVNKIAPYKNFQHVLRMCGGSADLVVQRKGNLINVSIQADGNVWLKKYRVERMAEVLPETRACWNTWKFGVS